MRTWTKAIIRAGFALLTGCFAISSAQAQNEEPYEGEHWPQRSEKITQQQANAVILAITDDIYDRSQERSFRKLGRTRPGSSGPRVTLGLYVIPHLGVDSGGQVIYLDMPYGEVLRDFFIDDKGLVFLSGDPPDFPITQPSHYTTVMDRSVVRDYKAHWLRREFTVQFAPSRESVRQAAGRQLERNGWSEFLKKFDPAHYSPP